MRCYTFQSKSVVLKWLKHFEQETTISFETTYEGPIRDKSCYNGKDFIYTFYRKAYDSVDYKKAWLKDNYYLTSVLKWYFKDFLYEDLVMLELIVPDGVGLFGELESKLCVSMETVQDSGNLVELVLPKLCKQWIVDYYLFNKIEGVPITNGIEIIPANYSKLNDKLIISKAPLIWDTSLNELDPLSLDDIPISSVPFEKYREKCRRAFYGSVCNKETNYF